jgi:hypothetical protein
MDWINDVIKDVSELDYSSPEGQPDVMLVTAEELRAILLERSAIQVVAWMAVSRSGTARFTDNPAAATELESYGWTLTPLIEALPNTEIQRR